jgi:hypothetical protein
MQETVNRAYPSSQFGSNSLTAGRAELLHQIRITSDTPPILCSYRLEPTQVPYKNRRVSPAPVLVFLKSRSNFRYQELLQQ